MFMMAMMDKGGNNQMSFPFMPNQSQEEEKQAMKRIGVSIIKGGN